MKVLVTDYTLYARRFFIGYLLMCALIVGLLVMAAFFVPGELRTGEIDSALTSGALSVQSIEPGSVVNLPYYLLQRLSFLLFGVSTLSIKLPSIILGALTVIGIFALTRSWFGRHIAIITTISAVATAQFLFLIQDGTPFIIFSFITIWLLAASTFITRVHLFSTFWKVIACVLMAVALYIPLGIYLVIALIITASLHPHIRYVIRRVSRTRLIIAVALGLAAVAPLVYAIVLQPSVALTLLGIPADGLHLPDSITQAGQTLFGFLSTSDSYLLRPLYSLGLALLICIGAYRLLTVKHTARSYTVLILSAFLIPLVLIDPTHATSLFPIAVIMIAMGVSLLIQKWYKLFPRNPYARIAGLVPISIIVVGLAYTGLMRYMNNYTYSPNILRHYSSDLTLLSDTIRDVEGKTLLITTESEAPFYRLVAHYDERFTVSNGFDGAVKNMLVTSDRYASGRPVGMLSEIVTNDRAGSADRFYVYKTDTK